MHRFQNQHSSIYLYQLFLFVDAPIIFEQKENKTMLNTLQTSNKGRCYKSNVNIKRYNQFPIASHAKIINADTILNMWVEGERKIHFKIQNKHINCQACKSSNLHTILWAWLYRTQGLVNAIFSQLSSWPGSNYSKILGTAFISHLDIHWMDWIAQKHPGWKFSLITWLSTHFHY